MGSVCGEWTKGRVNGGRGPRQKSWRGAPWSGPRPQETPVGLGRQEGGPGFAPAPGLAGMKPGSRGSVFPLWPLWSARDLTDPPKGLPRRLGSQELGEGVPGALMHTQSPPTQRAGARVQGLAWPCGSGTRLRPASGGGLGPSLPRVPSPPAARSRVSLAPLPQAARRGSPRPGEGRALINPRPEIPPGVPA